MSKPHIKYFKSGPLPIHLGATKSKKRYNKESRRLAGKGALRGDDDADNRMASTRVIERPGRGLWILVLLGPLSTSKRDLRRCCTHEASHVLDAALAYMAESCAGEEVRAYALEWISDTLYSELK